MELCGNYVEIDPRSVLPTGYPQDTHIGGFAPNTPFTVGRFDNDQWYEVSVDAVDLQPNDRVKCVVWGQIAYVPIRYVVRIQLNPKNTFYRYIEVNGKACNIAPSQVLFTFNKEIVTDCHVRSDISDAMHDPFYQFILDGAGMMIVGNYCCLPLSQKPTNVDFPSIESAPICQSRYLFSSHIIDDVMGVIKSEYGHVVVTRVFLSQDGVVTHLVFNGFDVNSNGVDCLYGFAGDVLMPIPDISKLQPLVLPTKDLMRIDEFVAQIGLANSKFSGTVPPINVVRVPVNMKDMLIILPGNIVVGPNTMIYHNESGNYYPANSTIFDGIETTRQDLENTGVSCPFLYQIHLRKSFYEEPLYWGIAGVTNKIKYISLPIDPSVSLSTLQSATGKTGSTDACDRSIVATVVYHGTVNFESRYTVY